MAGDWARELGRALRGLRSRPGTAAVAVLSLAVGVGVTSTAFSLLNVMALRELPGVERRDRLYALGLSVEREGYRRLSVLMAPAELAALRGVAGSAGSAGSRAVFSAVSGAGPTEVAVDVSGEPFVAPAEVALSDYFRVLGTRPSAGRFFGPEDDASGPAVVVISERFRRERLAGGGAAPGSPATALGRRLRINGRVFTVVGVAPEGFTGMVAADVLEGPASSPALWLPFGAAAVVGPPGVRAVGGDVAESPRWLRVVARAAPGVGAERVAAAMPALTAALARGAPGPDTVTAVVPGDLIFGPGSGPWRGAVTTAGFLVVPLLVLLIAAANAASLLLARAMERRRELAVRAALGASPGRLIRPVLAESVVLALVAGALGLLVARWAGDVARLFAVRIDRVPLDARVFLFTLATSIVVGLGFGLVPALRASRAAPADALAGSARVGEGVAMARARRGLVVAQVALSVVLLVVSGLFVRSVGRGLAVESGLEEEGLVLFTLDLGVLDYDAVRSRALWGELVASVRALPGVEAAALADDAPLAGLPWDRLVAGGDAALGEARVVRGAVGEGWFDAAGIPLLAGTAAGGPEGPRAVVVSRVLADRLWPGRSAVGRTVRLGGADGAAATIVGVAADVRQRLHATPEPTVYVPRAATGAGATLYVRSRRPAERVAAEVRAVVRRLDPSLPVHAVATAREIRDAALLPWRLLARAMAALGGIALALSVAGLYGVVSHSVSRRRREIGVRLALGATRRAIVGMVLRQALGTVGVGLVLGALAAGGVGMLLRSILFGVSPLDPVTFGAIGLLLLGVAALAGAGPARRAASIAPVRALAE